MSLKAFHLFFVAASILLCFGFGVWCLNQPLPVEGGRTLSYLGIGSLASGVGLLVYGVYVVRKLRHISYL